MISDLSSVSSIRDDTMLSSRISSNYNYNYSYSYSIVIISIFSIITLAKRCDPFTRFYVHITPSKRAIRNVRRPNELQSAGHAPSFLSVRMTEKCVPYESTSVTRLDCQVDSSRVKSSELYSYSTDTSGTNGSLCINAFRIVDEHVGSLRFQLFKYRTCNFTTYYFRKITCSIE